MLSNAVFKFIFFFAYFFGCLLSSYSSLFSNSSLTLRALNDTKLRWFFSHTRQLLFNFDSGLRSPVLLSRRSSRLGHSSCWCARVWSVSTCATTRALYPCHVFNKDIECELRALALLRCNLYWPLIFFNDALANCQTKAYSFLIDLVGGLNESKEFKKLFGVFLTYSNPRVFYLNDDSVPGNASLEIEILVVKLEAYLYRALVGVLDGISNDVNEHLLESLLVSLYRIWDILIHQNSEYYSFLLCLKLCILGDSFHELSQVEPCVFKFEGPWPYLR